VSAQRGGADENEPARSARLFFALWPDPTMQAALAVAAASAVLEAQNAGSGVRRVPPANFHLTLAFLGSVPLSRLAEVEEVAARYTQSSGLPDLPIEVVLDAIEHWRKPQVLVVTASETPPSAIAIAESLKRSLIDSGFSPDLKPFRVHATVARKVRRVTHELRIEPVHWRFESLRLVESKTGPDGSSYRPILEWNLPHTVE
jgi:2'-5' RNA ligase